MGFNEEKKQFLLFYWYTETYPFLKHGSFNLLVRNSNVR